MTASRLQVNPMGVPVPPRIPDPVDPVQVLRAARCLFGAADPDETDRLFREEERRNLEKLRRYVILEKDDSLPAGIPQLEIFAPETSRVISQQEIAQVDVINERLVLDAASSDREIFAPKIDTNSEVSRCEGNTNDNEVENLPARYNPGPLGSFRVRKFTGRAKPYSSTKQTLLTDYYSHHDLNSYGRVTKTTKG